MTWDDEKDTFRTRPDVPADEKLTASEWNAHVDDQENHSGRHEDGGSDELSVGGLSGVLADAQTPQTEAVEDIVGALLAGGTNISLTYDDANDVLTIDTSALNEEEVEDAVAALVTAGGGITVNYDDAAGTLSIAVDESALSFYDGTNLTADVDNQSITTDDSVINNSVTYPDGTVVTTSPGGGGGEWETIETIEDTDDTTSFDVSFSSMGSYSTHRVLFRGAHDGASNPYIAMQLSGYTSADYEYQTLSASNSGESQFILCDNINRPTRLGFIISSDLEGTGVRFDQPTIGLDYVAANIPSDIAQYGKIASTTPFPVSSVRVFSEQNGNVATGVAVLQGLVE